MVVLGHHRKHRASDVADAHAPSTEHDRVVDDGVVAREHADHLAREGSRQWDLIGDRTLVDGFVNLFAGWTYSLGLSLRSVQTGSIRQYVMFIVIGAIAIFVLISFFWSPTLAK